MRIVGTSVLLTLALCNIGRAQLTLDQKTADFHHLAGLFAKNYGPAEWKRDFQGFDLFNTAPWLNRVRATRDDLDFYQVMLEYAASFNDAHVTYQAPSNFLATLHFTTDIYEGRVLVDSINRVRLPAAEFPFARGWEVVSVDGRGVQQLIDEISKVYVAANPLSTRRFAAELIPIRPQALLPRAHELGEMATVVMKGLDNATYTFRIPWAKTGLPLTKVGPVPLPANVERIVRAAASSEDEAPYLANLRALQNCRIADRAVLGFGARTPVFRLPGDFVQRRGTVAADLFYSGTFQSGGSRIGFIRIPTFAPASLNAALLQFLTEVSFFQANTDGLIVDIMRNPGGNVAYTNILLQALIPYEFRVVGFEVRATSNWIAEISSAVESAKAQGAPPFVIGQLEFLRDQFISANSQMRGRTLSIPLDDITLDRQPLRAANGALLSYTKPLMVLIDETTASAGDMFAATIQDNGRGKLFGKRTMGAGGNVAGYDAGSYSEGFVSVTESIMIRPKFVEPPGYPSSPYIENVGVYPDIEADIMTQDNLLLEGRIFTGQFVEAMVAHIRLGR